MMSRVDMRDRLCIQAADAMEALERNYSDKHAALNHTAADLIRAGVGVKAASLLH